MTFKVDNTSKTVLVGLLGFAVVGTFFWIIKKKPETVAHYHAEPPSVNALQERLIQIATNYLPSSKSTLGEPDPRWDAILGGKVNADEWKVYSRNFGTTCGVVAAAWLEEAGGPPDMINRAAPKGSGFKPGWHIIKIVEGAKKRGWYRAPSKGELPELNPGDFYGSNHPAKDKKTGKTIDGTHIGLVLSVERVGDELHIETADGGQGSWTKQFAARKKRVLRISSGNTPYIDGTMIPAGAIVVSSPGVGNARLDWWIRNGGDAIA